MEPLILFNQHQILQLARRGIELLDLRLEEEFDDDDWEDPAVLEQKVLNREAGIGLMRLCATAVATQCETDLLPQAIDWYFEMSHRSDHRTTSRKDLCVALGHLIKQAPALNPTILALAQSPHDDLRATVAENLRLETPQAQALLCQLSREPHQAIASAARAALDEPCDAAWWEGPFGTDPTARLAPSDDAGRATLEAVRRWWQLPHWESFRHLEQLAQAVRALPDELALAFCERFLAVAEQRYDAERAGFDVLLGERPGGADVFWRLLQGVIDTSAHHYAAQQWGVGLLGRLEPVARLNLCTELLMRLQTAAAQGQPRDMHSVCATAAEIVARSWPPGGDATPVLDAYLALSARPPEGPASHDAAAYPLATLLCSPAVDSSGLHARLAEIFCHGASSVVFALHNLCSQAVTKLPIDEQRAIAESFLQPDTADGPPQRLSWAIEQRLGPLFDESRDGPRGAFWARLWGRPHLRAAMGKSAQLIDLVLPLWREQLRAATLSLAEADIVMRQIGQNFGGVLVNDLFAIFHPEFAATRKKPASEPDWHDLPDLRGPPTAEEWQVCHDLQWAALDDGQSLAHVLTSLADGPWQPAERALFDALVARADKDPSVVLRLACVMLCKPLPEHRSLLERLAHACGNTKRYDLTLLRRARRMLGRALAADRPGEKAKEPQEEEWPAAANSAGRTLALPDPILFPERGLIRQLAARAETWIASEALKIDDDEEDEADDDGDREPSTSPYLRYRRNLDLVQCLLRACGAGAALLRDQTLMPALVSWIEWLKAHDDMHTNVADELLYAVEILLKAGAPVDDRVWQLVDEPEWQVRQVVASGLDPKTPEAVAILEQLARDAHRDVRRTATEKILAVQDVPWWSGVFRRDPLAMLSAEQSIVLKPVMEALMQWMRGGADGKPLPVAELLAPIALLPPALALEVCECFVSDAAQRFRAAEAGLDAHMVQLPGGLEALRRVMQRAVRQEDEFMVAGWLKGLLTRLPADARRAVCLHLAATLQHCSAQERCKDEHNLLQVISETLETGWPTDLDASPLIEAMMSWTVRPDEPDRVSGHLLLLLRQPIINRQRMEPRLIEAFRAGCPRPFKTLACVAQSVVEALPDDQRRPIVDEILAKGDGPYLPWALEQLTGPLYAPDRHGPRLTLLERLVSEPHNRAALLTSTLLTQRALPLLRRQMLAGSLSLPQADSVMRAIKSLYGGMAVYHPPEMPLVQFERALEGLVPRRAVTDWQGLAAPEGPASEAEWQAYRRLQFAALDQTDETAWGKVLGCLPSGPWHPDDRALLEAVRKRIPRCDDLALGLHIAEALKRKPQEEDLPMFDELLAAARAAGDYDLLALLRDDRREFMALLDLEEPEDKDGQDEPEWMDEDDEDDDDDSI